MKERVRMQIVLSSTLKKKIDREAKKREITSSALVRLAALAYMENVAK